MSTVIELPQSKALVVDLNLTDDSGNKIDLSKAGTQMWFTAKRYYDDTDLDSLWHYTLDDDEFEILDAVNGIAQVKVPAANTSALVVGDVYAFDVIYELESGLPVLADYGYIKVIPSVTKG